MVRKVADQEALLALGRIDRGDEAEAELLGDHGARDLQRRQRHPRGGAEHDADDDLVHHQHQERKQRLHVDGVGGAVQRQDYQRQQQRDRELDANRNIGLAEPRQQHHHGADAGEYQHEGGGECWQQRDIDTHDRRIVPQPPMIRDDIRIM